jgi:GNAT superfamily N-acetyltransferase
MEFLPLIWEGEDYVPEVWDEWMAVDSGFLIAAVWQGRAVGLSHLVDLGGGEWWLEGLRVDPRLQGRHIGSHLHAFQVENWLSTSGTVVRLATHSSRGAVHRMCLRTGFSRSAEVSEIQFEAEPGAHQFRVEGREVAPTVLDRLLDSPSQRALGGMMDLGWRFARITEDRIADAAAAGGLWRWEPGGGVLVARVEDTREGRSVTVAALAPPDGNSAAFFGDLRRLAGSLNALGGSWLLPKGSFEADLVGDAGLPLRPGAEPLWIFERGK